MEHAPFPRDLIELQADWQRTYAALAVPRPVHTTALRRRLPPFPHIDLPRPHITTSHPNGYLWKRDRVDAWLAGAPVV
ncbi:hypothetical protein BEK98_43855 [Streptomyces diastatochromogenes]|uniref:Uncharacterized protein n=1 Tax=Streptomyces diastatochromogenes TaxID=42236 RepID=A0A233RVQ3_STRDA|nr:hypothetical protein BEK98_43855 [Streptomyces diastatochromogenes]